MALELRMAAEQRLKIEIPLMSLSDGATLSGIASRLAARLISGKEANADEEETLALAARHLDEEQVGSTTRSSQWTSSAGRIT